MKTIVYGAGATARIAAALLGDQVGGVVADGEIGTRIGECLSQHSDSLSILYPPELFNLLICIGYQHGGMNTRRREVFETLSKAGYSFRSALGWTWVHLPTDRIGAGCMLLPGVVAHDNAQIGVNCFVSSNTVIGHDAQVGSHSWINANVSLDGGAVVGEQCVIGAGAVIGAGVQLGDRTLVGPGAVVLRDTPPDTVWLAPGAVLHRFSSKVFGRM